MKYELIEWLMNGGDSIDGMSNIKRSKARDGPHLANCLRSMKSKYNKGIYDMSTIYLHQENQHGDEDGEPMHPFQVVP
jgi:hypothetical protein